MRRFTCSTSWAGFQIMAMTAMPRLKIGLTRALQLTEHHLKLHIHSTYTLRQKDYQRSCSTALAP